MVKTYTTPSGRIPGIYDNILKQTHVMVAGATGSGKSVVLNGLIYAALYRFPHDANSPKNVGLILIDNGKGVEFIDYKDLPHTLRYAYTLEESISALEYGLAIARKRFEDMRNKRLKTYDGGDVYILIDEFASLILNGEKKVSNLVQDIAQLGRAAKVHIILATQCPLAEVLPTRIKVNFDAQLGLRTRSSQDSRNILGCSGCELLPRYGQGFYMIPDFTKPELYNIPMVEQADIDRIVQHWMRQK